VLKNCWIEQLFGEEKHGINGFEFQEGLSSAEFYLNVEGSRANFGILVS
jgi:hypothetical protein